MDALMDPETFTTAVAGFAGYAGPEVLRNVIDGRIDLPNEAYGLAVIGGVNAVDVPYSGAVSVGAGVHTVEAAAERLEVRETIVGIGGA